MDDISKLNVTPKLYEPIIFFGNLSMYSIVSQYSQKRRQHKETKPNLGIWQKTSESS